MSKEYVKKPIIIKAKQLKRSMTLKTLEGVMHGKKGDYLVTGVCKEKYIVKQDIFEETYELVTDTKP